ncbi:MAG: virulence factor MviN [Actinomycetota bacterium]|nr:virulence factor MviN [Actinomycetota bacterium]
MTRRQVAGTVVGAAALVAVLTVAARLAGLGRNLVLARTVGSTELASIYQSVNTVPNIAYEVVAGGVLASLVVPLLARAVADEDRVHVDRTSSALLTWTVLTLTPLALLIIVAAEPIAAFLLAAGSPGSYDRTAVEVGASMLRVFAPQVVLYGIGIVLTGILQAHRRFGAPALAPLLSSLVVIAAYVTYAVIARGNTELGDLTSREELVLSVGTTLGVVVLSLSLVPAVARIGLRLRPSLRFPSGVARHVRSLAYAGTAALTAQQASVVVALLLGNRAFAEAVIVYTQAQTIFLLPWAVLAVPVATAVYPRLAERWSADDRASYRSQLAASTCVVVALMLGAAAAMVAVAHPLARIVFEGAPGAASTGSVASLSAAVVGFAAGLVGYGLFALLSRAMYAAGATAATAVACVGGWVVVIVADLLLSGLLPTADRVLALGLGNSIGMTVLAATLLVVAARTAGAQALAGVGRITVAGAAAGVASALLGRWLEGVLRGGWVVDALWQAAVVGVVTLVLYAGAVLLVARPTLRLALTTLRGLPEHHQRPGTKEVDA